ncbi:hypothetical protein BGI30_08415 [Snodgrassella alvi]|uniref:Uncharacterized protein n=1 Tax=Snodgrassella alvi TaxID=1196083 RepID=A0A855G3B3_9NEIS|nr:hypothetical protein BGI30_08415 [Snodgrassella alvi]PIT47377.1 hypothetical protein BHC51_05490 [Snodgrassella alvi]PIT56683.1 hypothetical protein BHC59_07285 [Snodgrassella alvi]PIT61008.1 hypothetical protein BHC57_02620 [Snodgrassella alvi]
MLRTDQSGRLVSFYLWSGQSGNRYEKYGFAVAVVERFKIWPIRRFVIRNCGLYTMAVWLNDVAGQRISLAG